MYSIVKAMTWEFARRCCWWILIAILAIVGMVALRSWALSLVGGSIEEWARDPEGRCLIFPIGFVASFLAVFPALCDAPRGFCHRLYTKPVPTWFSVGWKMLLGMLTSALICLASTSSCNWLVEAEFALVGPSVFFATGLAVGVAGIWSLTDFRLWKMAVWAAGAISLTIWFSRSYWDGGLWSRPTLGELLTMGVYVLAAYVFAVVSVASDRCGNTRPWPDIQKVYNRVVDLLSMRRRGFRSALAAQFWAEWRPRGLVMPAIAGAFIAIPTIGLLASRDNTDDAFQAMLGGALLLGPLFTGIFVGAFVGNRQGSKDSFTTFMATRPVSDSQLAFIVLKAAVASVLVTWLVLVTGALVSIFASVALGNHPMAWEALKEQVDGMPVWVPPLLVVGSLWLAYTSCSWTATIMLTGRQWVFATVNLVFWGGIILAFVLGNFGLVPRCALPLVRFLAFCGGIALTLVSAYMFVAARRHRFIGDRAIGTAGGIWLVMCTVIVVALSRENPVSVTVLICGTMALSIAAVAAAPLALAWNRHR